MVTTRQQATCKNSNDILYENRSAPHYQQKLENTNDEIGI